MLPDTNKTTHKLYTNFSQLDGSPRHILIYPERDQNLSEAGNAILRDRYLTSEETSPQEAFARACCAFSDDNEHAQRLYNYLSNQWAAMATPILSNGGTNKGLPISCFLNKVGDSILELGEHYSENLLLSTRGGGIGTDWSSIRSVGTSTSKGNKTTGVVPFIKVVDSLTVASWQGSTRRGATQVGLRIDHPEIMEFIEIRKPTGGVANRRTLNIHNCVIITDAFMDAVELGGEWELIDPHTKNITGVVDARTLWIKILKLRMSTGEPFLFFSDTANRALPEHLKKKGLKIHNTNLCTEIMLPTNEDRTAVCCLSSVNLEKFDEWKDDKLFIEDMLRMLDNVLEVFILEAPEELSKAVSSAANERSVGLGAMGFHLFLQSKGVPYESVMARVWNEKIFRHIKDECYVANLVLGKERGEAPDAIGTGFRFSHTNAIAPNANISVLCGNTSPSVEPFRANAFTQTTHSGSFLIKNKALDKLFIEKYKILDEKVLDKTWESVIVNGGSVQHLDFLDDRDKEIFKTASELNQEWIIDHAAIRQPFIDQGQSVNLFLPPFIKTSQLHRLHALAWKKGLKSLYYLHSSSVGKAEVVSKNVDNDVVIEPVVTLKETPSGDIEGCLSCEG